MSGPLPEIAARLEFALNAAEEASVGILAHYQRADLAVDLKGDLSPVTVADRGAEELLRKRIAQRFPGDGVLGEEFGESPSSNGFRWILDPIDGTKSFVHGVPLFGTLIGLERDGECMLGVCRFPALHEVVYAARGGGTWWQQGTQPARRTQTTRATKLEESLFCLTTLTGWERVGRKDAFERLVSRAGLTRAWGDCYGHALVATGRADVMVDPQMNPWDIAALIPIVEEAGGRCCDWTGKATIHGGNGVSVGPGLADEVLSILRAPRG